VDRRATDLEKARAAGRGFAEQLVFYLFVFLAVVVLPVVIYGAVTNP
jgi:hypothetical protein